MFLSSHFVYCNVTVVICTLRLRRFLQGAKLFVFCLSMADSTLRFIILILLLFIAASVTSVNQEVSRFSISI